MSIFKEIKDFKKEVVGNAVLFNEDCLKVMPEIADKSVDMILCDLPYGTTACKWDTIIPFDKLWEQYERIIKDNGAIVLFASQPFTSVLVSNTAGLGCKNLNRKYIGVEMDEKYFEIGVKRIKTEIFLHN